MPGPAGVTAASFPLGIPTGLRTGPLAHDQGPSAAITMGTRDLPWPASYWVIWAPVSPGVGEEFV